MLGRCVSKSLACTDIHMVDITNISQSIEYTLVATRLWISWDYSSIHISGQKKFMSKKNLEVKKCLGKRNSNIGPQNILGPKNFGLKKNLGVNGIWVIKKCLNQKIILGPKNVYATWKALGP